MNVLLTSDLHLGHRTAAKHRGFSSVQEHDEEILVQLLATTHKRDLLWILGDIAWNEDKLVWLKALPCRMEAVLGNHDKMQTSTYLKVFNNVWGAVKKYNLWLTHMPIHPQEVFRCDANIHGHIHKNTATPPLDFPYINVNWDFWGRPLSLEEIRAIVELHKE